MQTRGITIALALAFNVIAGCGRQVESPFPESGLLRALTRLNDLQLIKSAVSEWSLERDAVRVVEETLNFRVIGPSSSAAPLCFPLAQNPGLSLYVGKNKFSGYFDLIRADPGCNVILEPESFRLQNVKYPSWNPTSNSGAPMWWQGAEVVADAEVSQAGFYDLTLTARGRRVFEAVPRLELLVDEESISEFHLFVPRRGFPHKVTVPTYLEKGNRTFKVRFAKRINDVELRNDMGVFVMKLEVIPRDFVAASKDSLPEGNELTAQYKTRDLTLEQWRLFADDRNLTRTEQGLFISGEGGLDVRGEYRPAVVAPPGTIYTWNVRLPDQPTLAVGVAIEPTSWLDLPSPVTFTIDITPHGLWKRRHTLLEQKLDPWAISGHRRWVDVTLDLSRWAGRGATLRFSTARAAPESFPVPLSFWSEPRLRAETNPEKNWNVVIHLIDTLRKDHLGCYGYDKETSPTIDALAENGALFENPVSQFPKTCGSTASLLTGMYPVSHGCYMGAALIHPQAQTLAQALAAQGYLTFAVCDNRLVDPEYGYARGCDRFYALDDRHGSGIPGETPASLIVEAAKDCLEVADDRPFFLYIHSVYPHDFYWAPKKFRKMFTTDYKGVVDGKFKTYGKHRHELKERDFLQIHALYDAEIRYADVLTKGILDALETAGATNETLIIVTSDHGEEFFDHGSWGHSRTLFREVLDVPLVMSGPPLSVDTSCRIQQSVRLIDIAPTVLDILGFPPIQCNGESLLPLVRGEEPEWRTAISEVGMPRNPGISVRRKRFNYIKTNENEILRIDGGEFLFDMEKDPLQQANMLEEQPEKVAEFKEEAEHYFAEYRGYLSKRAPQSISDISEDVLEDLRALGYVK